MRISSNDPGLDEFFSMSQGNPGALNFLLELVKDEKAALIMPVLKQSPSLRGTNLYVLYSDICNRDLGKVATLCEKCPKEVLEDACSRQDYSGRDIVAQYFN